MEGDSKEHGIA
jgi:hypothetical protein